jgi:hypothetical protein
MLCNHVLFCAAVLHLLGGTKDQERWPQQNPGQGLQGIAAEIMHMSKHRAFNNMLHEDKTWHTHHRHTSHTSKLLCQHSSMMLFWHDSPLPTTHTTQPNTRKKSMHLIITDRNASAPHDRLAHVACACVLIITTAKAKGFLTRITKNGLVQDFSSNAL